MNRQVQAAGGIGVVIALVATAAYFRRRNFAEAVAKGDDLAAEQAAKEFFNLNKVLARFGPLGLAAIIALLATGERA